MPDEAPLAKPEPIPPLKPQSNSPISDPAAIFIAAATLFAIFINSQNVGPIQMMGGDPQVMAQAARLAEEAGADIVDINMGCPVPKVVKTSGGSSLLRDPDRAVRVAEAVVGAVSVPVTVKIRLGWDFTTRNYLEMATRLEATGIEGLAVHGRTRSPRYDPSADLTPTCRV